MHQNIKSSFRVFSAIALFSLIACSNEKNITSEDPNRVLKLSEVLDTAMCSNEDITLLLHDAKKLNYNNVINSRIRGRWILEKINSNLVKQIHNLHTLETQRLSINMESKIEGADQILKVSGHNNTTCSSEKSLDANTFAPLYINSKSGKFSKQVIVRNGMSEVMAEEFNAEFKYLKDIKDSKTIKSNYSLYSKDSKLIVVFEQLGEDIEGEIYDLTGGKFLQKTRVNARVLIAGVYSFQPYQKTQNDFEFLQILKSFAENDLNFDGESVENFIVQMSSLKNSKEKFKIFKSVYEWSVAEDLFDDHEDTILSLAEAIAVNGNYACFKKFKNQYRRSIEIHNLDSYYALNQAIELLDFNIRNYYYSEY